MIQPVIVFDLDDTLYPEREFVLSGFRAADEWLSSSHVTTAFYPHALSLFDSGHRGNIFNLALRACSISDSPELVQRLISVYRSHSPDIHLFSDAETALHTLKPHFRLALITDGYLETQLKKIAALNLAPLFQKIVVTDSFGREFWKPHARSYQEVCSFFGCDSSLCVYIADNPHKDFITAKKLGWRTIRIRRASGEHARLNLSPEFEAHAEISSLSELKSDSIAGVLQLE